MTYLKCIFGQGVMAMFLIPVLVWQKKVDLSVLQARLVYKVISRTTRVIQRNPIMKKKWKGNVFLFHLERLPNMTISMIIICNY